MDAGFYEAKASSVGCVPGAAAAVSGGITEILPAGPGLPVIGSVQVL